MTIRLPLFKLRPQGLAALLALAALWSASTASAQTLDELRQALQIALQSNTKLLNHPAVSAEFEDPGRLRQLPRAAVMRDVLWQGPRVRDGRNAVSAAQAATWFDLVHASEQVMLGTALAIYELQKERRRLELAENQVSTLRDLVSQMETSRSASRTPASEIKEAKEHLKYAQQSVESAKAWVTHAEQRYEKWLGGRQLNGMSSTLEPMRLGLPTTAQAMAAAAWAYHPSLPATGRVWGRGVTPALTATATDAGLSSKAAADARESVCRAVAQEATDAFERLAAVQQRIRRLSQVPDAPHKRAVAASTGNKRRLIEQVEAQVAAHALQMSTNRALHDRVIAYVRAWAAVGQLGVQLGLVQLGTLSGLREVSFGGRAVRCTDPGSGLNVDAASAPTGVPPGAEFAVADSRLPPVESRAIPTQREPASGDRQVTSTVSQKPFDPAVLNTWVEAIRKRNADALAALYVRGFAGNERNHNFWLTRLRGELSGTLPLKFEIDEVEVEPQDSGAVQVRMRQIFRRGNHMELAERTLLFQPVKDQWLISRDELRL